MPSDGRFSGVMQELRQVAVGAGAPPRPPIEPPRSHDDDDGMETRVKRLEDDVRAIRTDLMTINGRLANVEGKLDTLTNQVVSKIPSGLQVLGIIVGALVAFVALVGAAAKMAQWLKIIPG